MPVSASPFDPFKTSLKGEAAYLAGFPSYPRNFSRDVLLAALLSGDPDLLTSQLRLSHTHQGTKYDPLTGEEPGKIHHEYPGVEYRPGRWTAYNACDTTALYLIGAELLTRLDHEAGPAFMRENRPSLEAAADYLRRHVKDDLFYEFPPPGAEGFSLRVTYWKDSQMLAEREEPSYPVLYALAHFQAARGLQSAGVLLGEPLLARRAGRMFSRGIREFMHENLFISQGDASALSLAPSSDELHALAYIPRRHRSELPLEAIRRRAEGLETAAGYSCTTRRGDAQLDDHYHGYTVWPFEQALIHYGAGKFGLDAIAGVTERVAGHIGEGTERLKLIPSVAPIGNPRQLWSVAAGEYFAGRSPLRDHHPL